MSDKKEPNPLSCTSIGGCFGIVVGLGLGIVRGCPSDQPFTLGSADFDLKFLEMSVLRINVGPGELCYYHHNVAQQTP